MPNSMRASCVAAYAAALAAMAAPACLGEAQPSGARLTVQVAPLELPGVANACYTLAVWGDPAATTPVWERSGICANRFGDGIGGLSYVGTCDAQFKSNRVTLELEGLYSSDAAPSAANLIDVATWQNPCPIGDPCELQTPCEENADTRVTFDVTVMRSARQGFADIAVDFEDIFCSAKLDCQPELLHYPDDDPLGREGRGLTAVVALACTGGPKSDTCLYMNKLMIDCANDDYDTFIKPSLGPGNIPVNYNPGLSPRGLLFAAAIYRGDEQLGDLNKSYWNIALGLDSAAFAASGGCRLGLVATSSDGAWKGNPPQEENQTPPGAWYPYVTWDLQFLTFDDHGTEDKSDDTVALTCEQHPLDGGAEALPGVATAYTDPTKPMNFGARYCHGDKEEAEPFCGDGRVDGKEQCDGKAFPGGKDTCQAWGNFAPGGTLGCVDPDENGNAKADKPAGCTVDTSGCISLCGNDAIDDGEECDGDLFQPGDSCQARGYESGVLGCTTLKAKEPAECRVDISGCTDPYCGNGEVDVTPIAELCDPASSAPAPECPAGYTGQVVCASDCQNWDSAGCTNVPPNLCLNFVKDPSELCDPTAFFGNPTCQDLGFPYGQVHCALDCQSFDQNECSYTQPQSCNNGVREGTEQCDTGANTACCMDCVIQTGPCNDGLFCTGIDLCFQGTCGGGGNPCPPGVQCNEDTDHCGVCGDGIAAHPEQCDDGTVVDGTPNNGDPCRCTNDCRSSAGLGCTDGDPCTEGTVCDGLGGCAGGTDPCVDVPATTCQELTSTTYECAPDCGNGTLDEGEECDGQAFDLPSDACSQLGFASGTLLCTGTCLIDLGSCTQHRRTIDATPFHTCRVRPLDQELECWGNNEYGASSPPAAPAGATFVEVATGLTREFFFDGRDGYGCGLLSSGEVTCWGANYLGTPPSYLPAAAPAGRQYRRIDTETGLVCGIRISGELDCWGDNYFELVSNTPSGRFVDVSLGRRHICAVRADGATICWGYESGTDGVTNVAQDRARPQPAWFTMVSAAPEFRCARTSDGVIDCWGSRLNSGLLPPSGLPPLRLIEAGRVASGGIDAAGYVHVWGDDLYGMLAIPDDLIFADLALGAGHSCAVTPAGGVQCWGDDLDGRASPPSP